MPRAYVRQIYCFPAVSNSRAVDTLSSGLSGLARDVPYILARVVSDKLGVALTGTPSQRLEDVFSTQDLSSSIDYDTLRAGHFPPAAFLAPGIVPSDTLPPYQSRVPVFRARASLVRGGLILCVAVHHSVTDITGFGALLKIWASHCRDGSSRGIGFDANWLDRGPLFATSPQPHDTDSAVIPHLLHVATVGKVKPVAGRSPAGQVARTGPKDYRTAILYFPQQQLRALKDAANAHLASQGSGAWVSTSDVLSSLLWSAVIEAEGLPSGVRDSDREVSDTRSSTLSFPVQFRSALRPPLPRDFLGAAFLMTNARAPHEDVCHIARAGSDSGPVQPESCVDIPALANTALAIRRSLREIDDAVVRRVLAYLEAHSDIDPEAPLTLGPPRYEAGGSGVSVVSWADQGVYELNWGEAVGQCEAVRLPKMGSERDPIVLPRVPGIDGDDGGLEVLMSYDQTFMRTLIEGPIMKQFSTLRCLS
jgi:hypothetical protein